MHEVLHRCNRIVARASNEQDALQAVCDLLVADGPFSGASIGFNQAGQHRGSSSNRCFLLKVDGQLLGALTVSSVNPDAFTPELAELLEDWSEAFAQLLAAARRRALHGRANAWNDPGSDVAELQRTEAALRRSEAFLAKAQRLSATGSFCWIASTGEMVWSEETCRILGSDHRLAPTIADLLGRVSPPDLDRAREIFDSAARDGRDVDAELRLVMPDGSHKFVRIVAQAIGCPVTGEFVGAVMDITAAKEMKEALAFRDQVMGILGHDLRNPVAGILGIVGLTKLGDAVSPTLRGKLDHIEQAARRMSEMIETIVDFTRTRFAGKLPISPTRIDLHDVCSQVIDELAASHSDRSIEIEVRGDATGRWDPGRIAQVVSNLVGNALCHGDPGTAVRVLIEGDADTVALEVHNSGRAIDADLLPVLFEPFRRGEDQNTRRSRGLGLGLHIVKQIIAAHRGSISVQSSTAAGTTFLVSLPRSSGEYVTDGRTLLAA
ncbi:MAG TPA: PAS domain-containing sensor histidine kinase [Polyangia bacterium]|nr:PAS domain-containing sensor histidine kinase [Polyangia bacterium]